jgi:hypothetical protein
VSHFGSTGTKWLYSPPWTATRWSEQASPLTSGGCNDWAQPASEDPSIVEQTLNSGWQVTIDLDGQLVISHE